MADSVRNAHFRVREKSQEITYDSTFVNGLSPLELAVIAFFHDLPSVREYSGRSGGDSYMATKAK